MGDFTFLHIPLNFSVNLLISKVVTLAENALYRGRWVALLISKHISRINEPSRG